MAIVVIVLAVMYFGQPSQNKKQETVKRYPVIGQTKKKKLEEVIPKPKKKQESVLEVFNRVTSQKDKDEAIKAEIDKIPEKAEQAIMPELAKKSDKKPKIKKKKAKFKKRKKPQNIECGLKVIDGIKFYIVCPGDCLSSIADKVGVSRWREIAEKNNIPGPKFTIYPGQKLDVDFPDECDRITVMDGLNRAPYSPNLTTLKLWNYDLKGLQRLINRLAEICPDIESMSDAELDELFQKIRKLDFDFDPVRPYYIDGVPQILGKWMSFANFKYRLNIAPDWDERGEYAYIFKLSTGRILAFFKTCGNVMELTELPKEAGEDDKETEKIEKVEEEKPEKPYVDLSSIDNPEKEKSQTIEMYTGIGHYGDFKKSEGGYAWLTTKFQPFQLETQRYIFKSGIFARLAYGLGKDDKYDYSWDRWSVGLTEKIIWKYYGLDMDLDVGIGQSNHDGGIFDYESYQDDKFMLGALHLTWYERQMINEYTKHFEPENIHKWLTKVQVNLEYLRTYHRDHKHRVGSLVLPPNPTNNDYADLSVTTNIYDYKYTDKDIISPIFPVSIGYEWSIESTYYQFGPGIVFNHKDYDIFSIRIMNYKDYFNDTYTINGQTNETKGQWTYWSISVDPIRFYQWAFGKEKKVVSWEDSAVEWKP